MWAPLQELSKRAALLDVRSALPHKPAHSGVVHAEKPCQAHDLTSPSDLSCLCAADVRGRPHPKLTQNLKQKDRLRISLDTSSSALSKSCWTPVMSPLSQVYHKCRLQTRCRHIHNAHFWLGMRSVRGAC